MSGRKQLGTETRWEKTLKAIAPNGPYVIEFRAQAKANGYDATVTALVNQLNQRLFGSHYRENSLVQNRVLKTPVSVDDDTLFRDLHTQIEIHLEDFA